MCQFCGLDPAYALYFDSLPTEPRPLSAPVPLNINSTSAPVPNFFRLKKKKQPKSVIAPMVNPKLTPNQIAAFTNALSPQAVVLTPESGGAYHAALKRWSRSAEKPAQIVVKPYCAEDVSKAILFSRGHNLRFVAKCGGHSPGGCSSSDGGLVVDLGLMRSVHVKPEERIVVVDGGALWRDVNRATADYGLAVGECFQAERGHMSAAQPATSASVVSLSTVAMASSPASMGTHRHPFSDRRFARQMSYLTQTLPFCSLVCDNLIAAEIITADGSILNVSQTENEDLFWAIRGAGNRFGIVTKFIFKAYPQPDIVWAGPLVFPSEKLEPVIEALNEWYAKGDPKAACGLILGKSPDDKVGFGLREMTIVRGVLSLQRRGITVTDIINSSFKCNANTLHLKQPALICLCFYNGSTHVALESFAPLLSLNPLVHNARAMPYWQAQTLTDDQHDHTTDRIRFASANLRLPLSPPHIRKALSSLALLHRQVPRASKTGCLALVVQMKAVGNVGRKDMSFPWRDGCVDVGIGARWEWGGEKDDEDKDAETERKVIEWQEGFQKLLVEGGRGDDFRLYSNHEDHRGPAAREYGVNYMKLLECKRKWDPEGVFMKF
ncbi:hypothetical protein BC938DRAFT_483191 [Jimgerdemannia flammicorona]|uniref:FAD-binding PCMH-type domain-containing protein n=1 Tax=Jimgerdemannia flammicorona TaxID=994334 RepID=A0A433QCI3_9FUNG|nr:hypothetical protein BC938DRAFT_483191 [Jimgerdemannia flammicorona]